MIDWMVNAIFNVAVVLTFCFMVVVVIGALAIGFGVLMHAVGAFECTTLYC